MDIKKVQLKTNAIDESQYFRVTLEDGSVLSVPTNDLSNRHYQSVRQWYLDQAEAPFEFYFGEPAEPEFAETIYPPEPEEPEEPLAETLLPPPNPEGEILPSSPEEAARIQPPTEPETFLPR